MIDVEKVQRWEREVVTHGSQQSLFVYNLALINVVLNRPKNAVLLLWQAWQVDRSSGFHVGRPEVQRLGAKMLEMGGQHDQARQLAEASEEEAGRLIYEMLLWTHGKDATDAAQE